jgi:hypothetical protein
MMAAWRHAPYVPTPDHPRGASPESYTTVAARGITLGHVDVSARLEAGTRSRPRDEGLRLAQHHGRIEPGHFLGKA